MNPEEQVEVYKQTIGPALYILSDSGEEEVEMDAIKDFLGGELNPHEIGQILKNAHDSPATPLKRTSVSPVTYVFRDTPSDEIIENSRELDLDTEIKEDEDIIEEAKDKINSGEIETEKQLNNYFKPYAKRKTQTQHKIVIKFGEYIRELRDQYNGDMPEFLQEL